MTNNHYSKQTLIGARHYAYLDDLEVIRSSAAHAFMYACASGDLTNASKVDAEKLKFEKASDEQTAAEMQRLQLELTSRGKDLTGVLNTIGRKQ